MIGLRAWWLVALAWTPALAQPVIVACPGNAEVSYPFEFTFGVTGTYEPPLTWRYTPASSTGLPQGLRYDPNLSTDGKSFPRLIGTPAFAADIQFAITVTDNQQRKDEKICSFSV